MLGAHYRWQISSVLSILHRATGIGLCAGMVVVAWWIIAAASGPDAYHCFLTFAGSIPGEIMLTSWAWALFYHLLNGIRHLVWDIGRGYEIPTMTKSGWAVVILSFLLTLATWMAA